MATIDKDIKISSQKKKERRRTLFALSFGYFIDQREPGDVGIIPDLTIDLGIVLFKSRCYQHGSKPSPSTVFSILGVHFRSSVSKDSHPYWDGHLGIMDGGSWLDPEFWSAAGHSCNFRDRLGLPHACYFLDHVRHLPTQRPG